MSFIQKNIINSFGGEIILVYHLSLPQTIAVLWETKTLTKHIFFQTNCKN